MVKLYREIPPERDQAAVPIQLAPDSAVDYRRDLREATAQFSAFAEAHFAPKMHPLDDPAERGSLFMPLQMRQFTDASLVQAVVVCMNGPDMLPTRHGLAFKALICDKRYGLHVSRNLFSNTCSYSNPAAEVVGEAVRSGCTSWEAMPIPFPRDFIKTDAAPVALPVPGLRYLVHRLRTAQFAVQVA